MLRNPVDMIHSLYSHYVWLRHPTPHGVTDTQSRRVLSLEQALASQEARQRTFLDSFSSNQTALAGRRMANVFHTDVAMYADQVKRYLDVFGGTHVHIIIYDDLKTDTAMVYRNTLSFLNVDTTYNAGLRIVSSNERIRNVKLHQLMTGRDFMVKKLTRMVIPAPLRRRMRRFLRSLNEPEKPRAPMNLETRQWLEKKFRTDVERLSGLIDRDLVSL